MCLEILCAVICRLLQEGPGCLIFNYSKVYNELFLYWVSGSLFSVFNIHMEIG